MTPLTKKEFKKAIIKYFEKNTGLTLKEAKAKIKSELIIDAYGNTHNDRIKTGNVTLFFTNNTNYGNGIKNGYGMGWYISNHGFTGGSTVKLSSKL